MSFPLPGPVAPNASTRTKKRLRDASVVEKQALAAMLRENGQDVPENLQRSIERARELAEARTTKRQRRSRKSISATDNVSVVSYTFID